MQIVSLPKSDGLLLTNDWKFHWKSLGSSVFLHNRLSTCLCHFYTKAIHVITILKQEFVSEIVKYLHAEGTQRVS